MRLCIQTHGNYVSSAVGPRAQVNPLAETKEGELVAADAKLGFDDNAAFRQKEIFAMRDSSQEDPRCARVSLRQPHAFPFWLPDLLESNRNWGPAVSRVYCSQVALGNEMLGVPPAGKWRPLSTT